MSDYESSSGSRDAFSRIMGALPTQSGVQSILSASWLDTKLGPMIAIASDSALYLLDFVDRRGLEREIERLCEKTKSAITSGKNEIITTIEKELALYFEGKLSDFKTSLCLFGSSFQKQVWKELMMIPFGETCSYLDIAIAIGKPTACRAVAQANGANQLAIVIPCHRVINANGALGGYSGGVTRKKCLINLENRRKQQIDIIHI